LLHHVRGIDKNSDEWNKACDYVVNSILRKEDFELPEGYLYEPQFEGMDADQVYKIIHKEPQQNNEQSQQNSRPENGNSGDSNDNDSDNSDNSDDEDQNQNDNEQNNSGDDDKNGDDEQNNSDNSNGDSEEEEQDNSAPQNWGKVEMVDEDEASEAEAEAKEAAAEAMTIGKQAGDLPGFVEQMVKDLLEPKKNWRELLQKFMAEIAHNDYSWSKPSRRYLPMGLYLPSLESLEIGKVVFAIDTSISIDTEKLDQFVAEVKEAMKIFNFPVTVIHCDYKVQKVEELEDDMDIVPVGRGGTRFSPVFEYVNENLQETKALIYFTDGECWETLEEPEYETLWVISGTRKFNEQFGEVVYF
jgi:predicted metal-dependent peptidase